MVELLVVITMIGFLTSVLLGLIDPVKQIRRGQDVQRQHDITQIKTVLDAYYNDHNSYPATLDVLIQGNPPYIKTLPKDPSTGSNYVYALDSANPQWNVLYAKLTSYSPTEGQEKTVCPLRQIRSDCTGLPNNTWSCAVSGNIVGVNCPLLIAGVPQEPGIIEPTLPAQVTQGPLPTRSPTVTPVATSTPAVTATPTPLLAHCAVPTIYDIALSGGMIVCMGQSNYSQASSRCASDSHVCSIDEYLAKGGNTIMPVYNSSWLSTQATQSNFNIACQRTIISRGNGTQGYYFATNRSGLVALDTCSVTGYFISYPESSFLGSVNCCGGPLPTSPDYKRVFVTSTKYTANLGGLTGADAKCNERAQAAGLTGNWVAWLSTSTVNARDRIPNARYVRLDGLTIANNKSDLLDANINQPIIITENGRNITTDGYVMTGTNYYGGKASSSFAEATCNNWEAVNGFGVWGSAVVIDGNWTHAASGTCSGEQRLYCFEQ